LKEKFDNNTYYQRIFGKDILYVQYMDLVVTFKKRNAKYSLFAFGVYVAGQVCHRNIR
jgi:hypothetical protein